MSQKARVRSPQNRRPLGVALLLSLSLSLGLWVADRGSRSDGVVHVQRVSECIRKKLERK